MAPRIVNKKTEENMKNAAGSGSASSGATRGLSKQAFNASIDAQNKRKKGIEEVTATVTCKVASKE